MGDFGDSGTYNEHKPAHAELMSKMMTLVSIYVEQWYPTLQRLDSSTKRIKDKIKATMNAGALTKLALLKNRAAPGPAPAPAPAPEVSAPGSASKNLQIAVKKTDTDADAKDPDAVVSQTGFLRVKQRRSSAGQ